MPLYRLASDHLDELENTPFAAGGFRESDIERWLKECPDAIEHGLTIISQQFSRFEGSKRKPDLLAVDAERRLVVIELKRTDEGGHMELQALRYAAMVADMKVEQALDAYVEYCNGDESKRNDLVRTLTPESEPEPVLKSARPRIFLVSPGFSPDLTTAVMWLRSFDIDITCIKVELYLLGGERVLNTTRVLPLPGLEIITIRQREKEEEIEKADRARKNEKSAWVLASAGIIKPGTVIVVDPTRVANGLHVVAQDSKYRAKFADAVTAPKNVVWEWDRQVYSLTALTKKLRDELAILDIPSGSFNGYGYWCMESEPTKTLYELAVLRARELGLPEGDTSTLEE